jgi:1-deoxy-D-xylulose-5-phosphate reductoisomerase
MNLIERLNLNFAKPTKSLILLGATGSIGTTTLEYLRRIKTIKLKAISVHQSTHNLNKIIEEFQVEQVAITDEESYDRYIKNNQNSRIKFFRGSEGLVELIKNSDADTVLTAVVGAVGIRATIEAIKHNKKICLANKETLIVAGDLILEHLKESRSPVIPVDSEHNAAFQLLFNQNPENINKLILTASGGPLRDKSVEEIKKITKQEVLNHPTWKMGQKITVDSAGLINKGLEIIESHYLFGFSYDHLDVRIHKESYVHALIQLKDGSYMLSTSPPNMIFPIAHALHFPEPLPYTLKESQEPEEWPALKFYPVDQNKYPGFALCLKAGRRGLSAPLVLNASNEVAVELFLQDKVHFMDIPKIIQDAMENIPLVEITNLDLLLKEDQKTREFVYDKYNRVLI